MALSRYEYNEIIVQKTWGKVVQLLAKPFMKESCDVITKIKNVNKKSLEKALNPRDTLKQAVGRKDGTTLVQIMPKDNLILNNITIQANIKNAEGVTSVTFLDANESLIRPEITLQKKSDASKAILCQTESILLDIALCIIRSNGIEVSITRNLLSGTCRNMGTAMRTLAMTDAVGMLIQNCQGADLWSRVTAIFRLLKEAYTAGLLWILITSLLRRSNEYFQEVAMVTGMIEGEFATDGVGFFATIYIALDAFLNDKINDLITLSNAKTNLPETFQEIQHQEALMN